MKFTLSGFKTYIIGVIALGCTAAWVFGMISPEEFAKFAAVLVALGLITTRQAISKVEKTNNQ